MIAMGVDVAGGQSVYMHTANDDSDGSGGVINASTCVDVGYTRPHSMQIPDGSVADALVVEDGAVVVRNGRGVWVACREEGQGSSKLRLKIVGVGEGEGECVAVGLVVVEEHGSGAYEYI